MHEGVWLKKRGNNSYENFDNFFPNMAFSAFMGRSTPTTAFAELIKYFTYIIYRYVEHMHEGQNDLRTYIIVYA